MPPKRLVRSYEKPTKAWEGKVRQKAKSRTKPKRFRSCAINSMPLRGRRKYGKVCQLPKEKGLYFVTKYPDEVGPPSLLQETKYPDEVGPPSLLQETKYPDEVGPPSLLQEIEQPNPESPEGLGSSPEQRLGPCQERSPSYERSFDHEEQTTMLSDEESVDEPRFNVEIKECSILQIFSRAN